MPEPSKRKRGLYYPSRLAKLVKRGKEQLKSYEGHALKRRDLCLLFLTIALRPVSLCIPNDLRPILFEDESNRLKIAPQVEVRFMRNIVVVLAYALLIGFHYNLLLLLLETPNLRTGTGGHHWRCV